MTIYCGEVNGIYGRALLADFNVITEADLLRGCR